MNLIKETYQNEIIINKSRFIAFLYRVNTLDEVEEILKSHRKKYYDATHNCYAYIIGENALIQKASDDGEPSKTAGFPILDVLIKNNLSNILCVVTRYFGGILLGSGGLVRAYSGSASEVLKKAQLFEIKKLLKLILFMDYSTYNNTISKLSVYHIISTTFLNDVRLEIGIDPTKFDETQNFINNISNAKINIIKDDVFNIEVPYKLNP